MTAFPNYTTGTVAVANGATSIVGTGTIWSGVNVRPGDDIVIAGQTIVVQDVTDTTHLVIDAWPFATVAAGAAYKVIQRSPLRYAGGQAMADVSTLVAALNTDGFYVFVSSAQTVPDPSLGNNGQYAFQASTGKLWQKSSGVWNYLGVFANFSFTGAWSAATAYGINQVVTLAGSSYICILAHTNFTPPNATYWSLLAAAGATGPTTQTPIAAWVTATPYVVGPPASYVSQGGSSYQCLVAHTSGTFATDLAGGKWGLVAQAGVNAPTYGGSSATSFLVGTGSKAFTTQAGLAYVVGSRVRAASNANPANYMEGITTSYSGATLTINVAATGGTGTFADWNLSLAGDPGAGNMSGFNNLSEVTNPTTALSNIGAAPYDAESFNNIIINGGMEVDQANSGTAVNIPAGTAFSADGWIGSKTGSMVCSVQQVADAPPGFSNSLKVTVSTAAASIAAGDYTIIQQNIEGFRTSRLQFGTAGASSVTLGFWTKIHRTGTYSGSLRNGVANRSYVFNFTQNVADAWEYKTVTIPGDIAGTWVGNTNAASFTAAFAIAAGATFTTSAGSWTAGNLIGATGTTNGVAATTDVFQITGVTLLPGTVAPTAAQSVLLKRSFDQEVALCQRYYQKYLQILIAGYAAAGTGFFLSVTNPPMRAAPTMSLANTTYSNASGLANNGTGTNFVRFQAVMTATGTGYAVSDAILDARL